MVNKLILVIAVFLFSCSPKEHVEYEYYEDSKNVRFKRSYSDINNDSIFAATIYHKNGKVYAEGLVIDNKYEGEWRFWYQDGTLKNIIFYDNGDIQYDSPNEKIPYIILSDSLTLNKRILLKAPFLYPAQKIIFESDGKVDVEEINDPDFDYAITSYSGTSVEFYYDELLAIKVDTACIKNLYDKKVIPDNNYQYIKMYRREKTKIGRANIYK